MMSQNGISQTIDMQFENFLHRGCSLANSGYIYGLVLYVGDECKIFKNAEDTKLTFLREFAYGYLLEKCQLKEESS